MRRSLGILLIAAVSLCGWNPTDARAEFPDKPFTIIVPWPPGDLEDVTSRMIAEDFQKKFSVPAAVVNKPGGGGGPFPGAVEVAKGPADGSMVGAFVISIPLIGHKIGIPELKEDTFEPLGIYLTYPFVIATAKDKPYKTMQDLAEHAKSNKVVLGHFGAPLPPTKITMALAKKMGFAYASDAAFDALDCNTLASGDADVINTTLQLIQPCLDKVTVLASITENRIPLTPDAPTVGEIDSELGLVLWNGLFVRKEVPQEARDKIVEVVKAAVMSDRMKQLSKDTGAEIYWKGADESKAQIAKQAKEFAAINALLE